MRPELGVAQWEKKKIPSSSVSVVSAAACDLAEVAGPVRIWSDTRRTDTKRYAPCHDRSSGTAGRDYRESYADPS